MSVYYGNHGGIVLNSGYLAKNPVTIAANGTITGDVGGGINHAYGAIYSNGAYAWTVCNYGTVDDPVHAAIQLGSAFGSTLFNGRNAVAIGADQGVSVRTINNYGTITSLTSGAGATATVIDNHAGGLIAGYGAGVSTWTLVNYGTISAFGEGADGIEIGASATAMTNHGLIVATDSDSQGFSGTGTNYGTITGGIGVVTEGNTIVNEPAGLINGITAGIYAYGITGALSFTNYGTVSSRRTGISLVGATVTNGASGTIAGQRYGVYARGRYQRGYGFPRGGETFFSAGVVQPWRDHRWNWNRHARDGGESLRQGS